MRSRALLLVLIFVVPNYTSSDVTDGTPDKTVISCNATSSEDTSVFRCDPWTCVPATARCNGVPDCNSGEDETVAECGCLPNEFRCSNSCIDLVRRCDRQRNCDDGEDEEGCESFVCPVTHFKCTNHFCVPEDIVCNFVDDCGDNSDELNCSHRRCWKSEFRCENGECIRPGFVCDGQPDCKDHSDEITCSPEMFRVCGDGSRIHKHFWCDNWPECPDNHADELFCSNCTADDEYLCPNGRCIKKANVCDSLCDCVPTDKGQECADEKDCGDFYSLINGISRCENGVTVMCTYPAPNKLYREDRCIAQSYICDNHNDCHNGDFFSDEFGCTSTQKDGGVNCSDGRVLPKILQCDFKWDCLEGEDERNCTGTTTACSSEEFQCENHQCIPKNQLCDLKFDCWDKSDELYCSTCTLPRVEPACLHDNSVSSCSLPNRCQAKLLNPYRKSTTSPSTVPCSDGFFKCKGSGQCLSNSLKCDFFEDCPDGSDETECWTTEPGVRECAEDEFRCDNGQCIPAEMQCFSSGKVRSGCADGSHLRNCGNWTCSPGAFKCRNGPCIDMNLRCNKQIDCKGTWVDEDGCPFQCSNNTECECLDTRINCSGLELRNLPQQIEPQINRFNMANNFLNNSLDNDSFLKLDRLVSLDLSNNSLVELPPLMFRTLWRLHSLNLRNNLLTVISNGTFFGLSSLSTLHLQDNRIEVLEPMAFYGLSALRTLDLKKQLISNVSVGAFVGLRNLSALDLSCNQITFLIDGSLNGMPKLQTLDLSDNHIKLIGSNVFRSVSSLTKLVSDEFRFCCLARHVQICLPPPDEFSSCEDLMSNLVLRVCVWVLGVIATLGNVLVIAWRLRFKHSNQVHSFLIMNLAIGDLFMGSYLLIIASVDAYYRGVYFIHDSYWRSSDLCNLAGFISTFSSELSVFTLTVITLDRFLVIIFPFRVRRMEMTKTKLLMAAGWLVAALLSGLPLFRIDYFRNFYGRSGVCLALHITPEKPNGWEYSVFVFLFLNLASFSIIALGYLWMYIVARTTQQAVQKDVKTSDGATMARRMTLIVATDAACWLPIILLGILSLGGITVPPQVFAWVAVFVLPLNAAVNPILYTLSTAPFLGPARKGLRTFKRSFKLSLTTEQRRTYTSSIGSTYGQHCNPCECSVKRSRFAENGSDNLQCQQSTDKETIGDSDKENCVLFSVTPRNQQLTQQRWRSESCHPDSSSAPTQWRQASIRSTVDTAVSSRGEVVPLRHFCPDNKSK